MKSNHVVSSSFSWPSKKISWSSKEEVSFGKNVLYLVARWFFKNAPIHSSTSVSCPVSQHELNISSTYTQKQMVWFSLSFFFFLIWFLTRKTRIIHSMSNSCIMTRCTSNDHLWGINEKKNSISDPIWNPVVG